MVVQGQHVEPVWPWHLTLTLSLLKQIFKGHICSWWRTIGQICIEIHLKLRSYGPDKNLTFKCEIDLGSTWTNVSNGKSTRDGEQLCQIIICILKSIRNWSGGNRTDGGRTHARTHIHRTVVVTTMSCLLQAGSTIKWTYICQWERCKHILSQNKKYPFYNS